MKRAALLHGELGSLRCQLATFTGLLDRYPDAFLLTDRERRTLYSNAAAHEITASRDGLAIESGRLVAISVPSEAAFAKAVAESAAASLSAPAGDSSPFGLQILSRYSTANRRFGQHSAGRRGTRRQHSRYRRRFSFTPAEARVAARLVLGQNTEEIAAESKTSVETVRTHIKRIFSKTAASRQSKLVSLILRSIPFR